MGPAEPPFLSLSFYLDEGVESDSFGKLVTALHRKGATFTGRGLAHRGNRIQTQPFASITDQPPEITEVSDFAQFNALLIDENLRLVQVEMAGASGINPRTIERVGFVSISAAAAGQDRHPVAINTSGEVFTGTLRVARRDEANTAGRRATARFLELVRVLRPSYGAIGVEMALECPTDLRRDPRTYAFQDFFVSARCVGQPVLARIAGWATAAYVEPLDDGIYVSCTPEFNPLGKSIDGEQAASLSTRVGKLIAATGPIVPRNKTPHV